MNIEEIIKQRCLLATLSLRTNEEDTIGFNPISWSNPTCQILLCDAHQPGWLKPTSHRFWQLLEFDELSIDQNRMLVMQGKSCLTTFTITTTIDTTTGQWLNQLLLIVLFDYSGMTTCITNECCSVQPRSNTCDFCHNGIERDKDTNIVCSDIGYRASLRTWQVMDSNKWLEISITTIEKDLIQCSVC